MRLIDRSFRFFVCLAIIGLVSLSGAQLANSAWPRFRGDNSNTGCGKGYGAIPVLLWSVPYYYQTYTAMPVIGPNGTVYAGPDGAISALDMLTGAQKWQIGASGYSNTSVALGVNTAVYWPYNLFFGAFDPVTGASWFQTAVANTTGSSPAIGSDGTVYVGCNDQNLYAFDGTTGAIKWKYLTGDSVVSSPAIGSDGTIYVGSDDHTMVAINPTGTTLKWKFQTGGRVRSSPAIGADGTIYFTSDDGFLYALNSSTGAQKWAFNCGPISHMGTVGRSPAIGPDGTVYAGSSGTTTFYAVNPATGAQIWSFATEYLSWSSPTVAGDGTVYMTEDEYGTPDTPKLYAINGKTGAQIWTYPIGASDSSPAINTDGTIYVGSTTGFYAFETIHLTGLAVKPAAVGGGLTSTGTVTSNIAAGSGGSVVALACDNPSISIPSTVTIPSGSSSATFTVNTHPVDSSVAGNISATLITTLKTTLTVNPAAVAGISLSTTSVLGGNPSTATVTLATPAGPSGVIVNLQSDNPVATVPATVVVPAGQKTATFTVTTEGVDPQQIANISAAANGGSAVTPLTITPAVIASFVFNPVSTVGGGLVTATITLNGPAGQNGSPIALQSSDASAPVTAKFLLPAEATSGTFNIATKGVNTTTVPVITATLDGVQTTANFTVTPAALTSLSLAPSTVAGGNNSTGTITLNGLAGSAGTTVLLSSNTASAILPKSVTVASGQSSANFQITTTAVNSQTAAQITATMAGASQSATLTITPATLSSVTLNPSTVLGGGTANGTVSMNGNTGPGGAVVSLSSNLSGVTVPATVTIPVGKSTTTFNVSTQGVNTQATATISATVNGQTQQAVLTITAAALSAISFSPSHVVGGFSSTGTVTLSGVAGPAGAIVSLSSNSNSVVVPATVTVAAGAISAEFSATTSAVNQTANGSVTGSLNGNTQQGTLSVVPATLASVTLNPATTVGGISTTGTVSLNGAAGSNGTTVILTSSNSAATVPPAVSVPAGKSSVTFNVATGSVSALTTVTITATSNGISQTANLQLTAVALASMFFAPSTVAGVASTTGTVTLTGPAPAGGLNGVLSTNSALVSVPHSVSIPAGQSSASFLAQTAPVSAEAVAIVTVTLNGMAQTAQLTLEPLRLASISFVPSIVAGGNPSTGTVSLNGIAPKGGYTIKLSSGGPSVTVPATVTIAAGGVSQTFKASTSAVASQTTVTVTAKLATTTQTGSLTVTPPALTGLTASPSSVTGGAASVGTVVLSGNAPAGGLKVQLSSGIAAATVPTSVTVPAGKSNTTFAIKTSAVGSQTSGIIQASVNGVSESAALTVLAPAVAKLALSPASLKGGSSSTGTVTISGPAPAGGFTVTISSSAGAATVPQTVSIAQGKTSATFSVKTTKVSSKTTATITASTGSSSAKATLTIS